MEEQLKNTGVLIEPKIPPTDFVAGAVSGIIYKEEVPSGDHSTWFSGDEKQRFPNFDTMACVTFSALNEVENRINRMSEQGLLSEKHLEFLKSYRKTDGKVHFSKRFTAKMSGTTIDGNYLQVVGDSIRNDGLVPETDWPANDSMTREEYYTNIPPSLIAKGREWKQWFETMYEWVLLMGDGKDRVATLKYHLKQSPIQVATHLDSSWSSGNVTGTSCTPVHHAYTIYNIADLYKALDHYTPFRKNVDINYCIPWAMKYVTLPIEPTYYVAAGKEWHVTAPNGKTKTLVNLNYRTSPRVLATNKVGTLPAGTEIEIIENAGQADGYHWLKIRL